MAYFLSCMADYDVFFLFSTAFLSFPSFFFLSLLVIFFGECCLFAMFTFTRAWFEDRWDMLAWTMRLFIPKSLTPVIWDRVRLRLRNALSTVSYLICLCVITFFLTYWFSRSSSKLFARSASLPFVARSFSTSSIHLSNCVVWCPFGTLKLAKGPIYALINVFLNISSSDVTYGRSSDSSSHFDVNVQLLNFWCSLCS